MSSQTPIEGSAVYFETRDKIARLREDQLATALSEKTSLLAVLKEIAEMPDEDDEWQGCDYFHDVRKRARLAVSDHQKPHGQISERMQSGGPGHQQRAEELNQARDDLERELDRLLGRDSTKLISILERFIDANIKWATNHRY